MKVLGPWIPGPGIPAVPILDPFELAKNCYTFENSDFIFGWKSGPDNLVLFCEYDCLKSIFINNLLQHFKYLNELSFLIFLKLFFSF